MSGSSGIRLFYGINAYKSATVRLPTRGGPVADARPLIAALRASPDKGTRLLIFRSRVPLSGEALRRRLHLRLDDAHALPLPGAEPEVEAAGHGEDVRRGEPPRPGDVAPRPDHKVGRQNHDRPGQAEGGQGHE